MYWTSFVELDVVILTEFDIIDTCFMIWYLKKKNIA